MPIRRREAIAWPVGLPRGGFASTGGAGLVSTSSNRRPQRPAQAPRRIQPAARVPVPAFQQALAGGRGLGGEGALGCQPIVTVQ
jgi:hypothetical protein